MTRTAKQPVETPENFPEIKALEVGIKYAQDIVSGAIVAGKLVIYAAKRFIEELALCARVNGNGQVEGSLARGLIFDESAAQNVVDFFGFLKHSKGEWGGETFRLEPWQVFILVNLFGWYKLNGTRRFNEVYIEIARKNGKTTFLAGIGLYLLLMDDEPGAEVYCAATKKDQAKICFDEAVRMRKASKFLTKRINAVRNNLSVLDTNSKFEPLSSEDDTLDGLNIHGCLVDELHAHPDRKLYDVLFEATKARRQPMMLSITTAGYDRNGICYKQREYGRKIVEGIISNRVDNYAHDNFFAYIACVDDGDDWADTRCWIKANPNLGISVKLDALVHACSKAKEDATALNSFLRKHLNKWTSQDVAWMNPDKWAACRAAGPNTDVKKLRTGALETMKGRRCFGGLDLSSKIDLSSFYLVFPPKNDDPLWRVLGWNWVPELNVPDRVKKDKVPYDVWIREGFLEKTDGNVVDQAEVRDRINAIKKQYQIEQIGFDSWNNTQLSVQLQSDGLKMVETRQGYKTFSEPMKELMGLVLAKKLEHYGDPILSWAASNVAAITDPAGNVKPDKEHAKEKIDPVVAVLMGMAGAIANPEMVSNPYNERGIIFI